MARNVRESRQYFRHIPSGGIVAEIGVGDGTFSEVIWTKCKPRKLVLVDAWIPFGAQSEPMSLMSASDHLVCYRRVMEQFSRRPNIQVWRMSSEEAAEVADTRFDFVYIDADHRYEHVLSDLRRWSALLSPQGVIGGHDHANHRPDVGVIAAVKDFCLESRFQMVHLTEEHWPSYVLRRAST